MINYSLLKEFVLNKTESKYIINNIINDTGIMLPKIYCEFFQKWNGGEGFVGENYLIIWKIEDVAKFNKEYEVDVRAPGIFLFGSSGGGEGYGFDTRVDGMPIVRIPFIGMDLRYVRFVARNFDDFFDKLATCS